MDPYFRKKTPEWKQVAELASLRGPSRQIHSDFNIHSIKISKRFFPAISRLSMSPEGQGKSRKFTQVEVK